MQYCEHEQMKVVSEKFSTKKFKICINFWIFVHHLYSEQKKLHFLKFVMITEATSNKCTHFEPIREHLCKYSCISL